MVGRDMLDLINLIFSESGEVRCGIPYDREVIYVGRNGNVVERIRVTFDNNIYSYIYKPLTNYPSIGKEVWVHENLISKIPQLRFPKIELYSTDSNPEKYWMILEDVGHLEHSFGYDVIKAAAALIPFWHILPTDLIPSEFEGHSPGLKNIQALLISKAIQMRNILQNACGLTKAEIDYFYRYILLKHDLGGEIVISHGDLYSLNIAYYDDKLLILDWEYIHTNSVYWDLYNLMDITSPFYRRPILKHTDRIAILADYMSIRKELNFPVSQTFIYDYFRYSTLHCVWLLILIEGDLEQGKFEKSGLLLQQQETIAILRINFQYLFNSTVEKEANL
jgi:hypothetical protein